MPEGTGFEKRNYEMPPTPGIYSLKFDSPMISIAMIY